MSMSFRHLARVPFTTQRPPAQSGGKRGNPVNHLTDPMLRCTPLDPVDLEVRQRLNLPVGRTFLKTFVDQGIDLGQGDTLIAQGKSYPVYAVGVWAWMDTTYREVILEELRGQ